MKSKFNWTVFVMTLFGLMSYAQQTNINNSNTGITTGGLNVGTPGNYSTLFGYTAGQYATGTNNAIYGYNSGQYSGSGYSNSIFGNYAGQYSSGSNNSYFGRNAGQYNSNNGNTILGIYSGAFSSGSDNALMGSYAGFQSSGNNNAIIGASSGYFNNGSNNVLIGYRSAFNNKQTGNVIIGHEAAYAQNGTYGGNSVVIGYHASFNAPNLIGGTIVGSRAGYNASSAYNSVYLGASSGYNATGSHNVFLGPSAGYSETGNHKLYIENTGTTTPLIYGQFDTDQIGINTNYIPTEFTFAVNGKAIAEEVQVTLYSSWPDYVFQDSYNLPSLKDVELQIKEKGHLQNIPSAKEVADNGGFLLGEMNVKLLEKIEELTLYTIAQEKKIEAQEQANKTLVARIEKLEAMIKTLMD